jgi:hypothetical protein
LHVLIGLIVAPPWRDGAAVTAEKSRKWVRRETCGFEVNKKCAEKNGAPLFIWLSIEDSIGRLSASFSVVC